MNQHSAAAEDEDDDDDDGAGGRLPFCLPLQSKKKKSKNIKANFPHTSLERTCIQSIAVAACCHSALPSRNANSSPPPPPPPSPSFQACPHPTGRGITELLSHSVDV